jgi:hypothetical protein
VRAAVTYFGEPAPNTPVNVVHPQVTYSQDFGANERFGLDVAYDADIVTGATPQVFGIDAVTSATSYDEVRHHGALGVRFMTDLATLSLAGGFAGESDYLSATVTAGMAVDMFERNSQLTAEYTRNFDRVCDANNSAAEELLERQALDRSDDCFTGGTDLVTTRKLSVDSLQLGWTQVITPYLLLQFGVSGQILNGFQENPYRQVLLGFRAVQESLPEVRNRVAGYVRSKWALRPIRGAVEVDARGYTDSWAVDAVTLGAAWDQYIARPIVLRARVRWHAQSGARFYRDGQQYSSGGPIGSYWTGDRELSPLMNTTVGVKATYQWRAQAKPIGGFMDVFYVSMKADALFYRSLGRLNFGERRVDPTQSPNFERTDGFLDAIVVQAQVGFDF